MDYAVNDQKAHRILGEFESIGVHEKRVKADADGWIPHSGYERPINHDAFCDIQFSWNEGEKRYNFPMTTALDWGKVKAYRPVISEPAQPDCLPPVGSEWTHTSGRVYRVTGHANEGTTRPDDYPVTIIYQNVENETVWCRPASDWARSFRPILEPQPVEENDHAALLFRLADFIVENGIGKAGENYVDVAIRELSEKHGIRTDRERWIEEMCAQLGDDGMVNQTWLQRCYDAGLAKLPE